MPIAPCWMTGMPSSTGKTCARQRGIPSSAATNGGGDSASKEKPPRHCGHSGIGSSALSIRIGRTGRSAVHASQPHLAPKRHDAARAQQTAFAVAAGAIGALEYHRRSRQFEHLAGRLVDDATHPVQHPEALSAIAHHLLVEAHAAIPVSLVESVDDLPDWTNLGILARLQ